MVLLCENNESNELLGTGVREALISTLLPQVDHEVQNSLTTQHLVTHVRAQHDG